MTVICLTNCPPKLRGDLSKWLIEINTGVYVGNINARVREELWNRITENIRSGQATMVFRTSGEQRMDFRVHNTTWKPVDYDGLKLIMRPGPKTDAAEGNEGLPQEGFSKAAKNRKARFLQRAAANESTQSYTVLDLETTGLNYNEDAVIELAALRVREGKAEKSFTCLVHTEQAIPVKIQKMTGITNAMLRESGIPVKAALETLVSFIGKDKLVCWNAAFDLAFLQMSCRRNGVVVPRNKTEDAMKTAQRCMSGQPDYRLVSIAQHFGFDTSGAHRALQDCILTHNVYVKLNEIRLSEEREAGF